MSAKVNPQEDRTEPASTIKVVAYPKELTLMSEYMNDVQAKRFKNKTSFQAFIKSGLNLTLLKHEAEAETTNIIDSGIRLASPQYQPDAAA